MVVISPTVSEWPYNRATNSVPTTRTIGDAYLKTETPSGSTRPVMLSGMPRVSAPFIIAGSDAKDERDVKAMACAVASARAKARLGTRATAATIGYNAIAERLQSTQAIRMK